MLRSSAQLCQPFVQGAALQQPETHVSGVQGQQFPIHRAGEHSVSWVNSATLPRAEGGMELQVMQCACASSSG